MRPWLPAALLALAPAAAAAQTAHEHGAAELLVAVEGDRVYVELVSPAASLLGFEHRPRNESQWRESARVIQALQDEALVRAITSAGDCRRAAPQWSTGLFDANALAAHQPDDGSDGRDHRDDSRHARDDDHHPDDEDHADARHADITVSYTFECGDSPESLEHNLFQAFGRLEALRVSLVTADRQRGIRQRRGQPSRIDL